MDIHVKVVNGIINYVLNKIYELESTGVSNSYRLV